MIFSMELHPFKRKKQKKIEDQVQQASSRIAVELIDLSNQQELSTHVLELGEKPRGVSSKEYIKKVNDTIMGTLGELSLTNQITFEPLKTYEINTKTVEVDTGDFVAIGKSWHVEPKKELSLAYSIS